MKRSLRNFFYNFSCRYLFSYNLSCCFLKNVHRPLLLTYEWTMPRLAPFHHIKCLRFDLCRRLKHALRKLQGQRLIILAENTSTRNTTPSSMNSLAPEDPYTLILQLCDVFLCYGIRDVIIKGLFRIRGFDD